MSACLMQLDHMLWSPDVEVESTQARRRWLLRLDNACIGSPGQSSIRGSKTANEVSRIRFHARVAKN